MIRSLAIALWLLCPAVLVHAQAGSVVPIEDEETGELMLEGGTLNPYNGHGTQFESRQNPRTGAFERRSRTVSPNAGRVVEREEQYDPETGGWMSRAVQRDPWSGQALETWRLRNTLTGESVQFIGQVNPMTGQSAGFIRRTQTDPATGLQRRDAGQFNTFFGGPGVGGFHGNTAIIHPYTGQSVQGFWPPR